MTQDPKAVVERFWVEVWNDQNPAAAEELLAEGFVWTTPTLGTFRGRAEAMAELAEIRAAFPDMTLTVEAIVVEGDRVVTKWANTATHRGPYRGADPTGQEVGWAGMTMHRVVDGQIVEHHAFVDAESPGSPHEIATR